MSQFSTFEDMVSVLEKGFKFKPRGVQLSIDADFIWTSFGRMSGMEFVFGTFDPDSTYYDMAFCTRYPLTTAYMRELND